MEGELLNYNFINLLHKAVAIMVYKTKQFSQENAHFCAFLQGFKKKKSPGYRQIF